MENFIMLPNKLIWNNESVKDTYLYSYGEKILHIFSYLDGMTNRFGRTIFTIKDMIESCGLTPKSGAGKVNNQFKDILIDLQSKKIIETTVDLNSVKVDSYINCIFNIPIDKTADNKNTKFFNVTYKNYLTLINYKGELNKLTLLKCYYYICSRLSRREVVEIDGKKITNQLDIVGGKAECMYDTYVAITEDLDITEATWCLYIKELNKLDLVFFENIGNVKKGKETHIANNVYCINKNELSEALNQSELFYITNGYSILGKKTDAELRVINGLRGKIKQEQNINKDTSKLESKLEKLEKVKKTKNTNKAFEMKTLFEENDGQLLSEIYDEINYKVANKYYKLEISLGLIDEDSELLVDYDYYKWVIQNYEESKHDYYVNCVKKHIRESNEEEDNKKVTHIGKPKPFKTQQQIDDEYEKKEDIFVVHEDYEPNNYIKKEVEEINNYYIREWDEQFDYHGDEDCYGW